jgi:hypothetical protein
MLAALVHSREVIPLERSIDVRVDGFMADELSGSPNGLTTSLASR